MTTIRRGLLSDLFVGVAAKTLSVVETDPKKSNQHEFNGSEPLKKLFGLEAPQRFPTRFIWLGEEQEAVPEDGFITWAKYREGRFLYGKPRKPEYRLYYSGNAVTSAMKSGDTIFVARRREGTAMVIVAPAGTTMQSQLLWLFGIAEQELLKFTFKDIEKDKAAELDFAARYILDELGLELEEPQTDTLDALLEPFGMTFPKTAVFSQLARTSLPHIKATDDADRVVMAWLEQEELLFKRLERRIVAERLRTGFVADGDEDVDGFLKFSLSVQNRRKSRAGRSLENHLEELFRARDIRFQRGVETENGNEPDFLFPGQAEYRDAAFPTGRLTMLGSKSTLKDRWRQVLAEARRIERKHLVTLEPGISVNQTNQMQAEKLQLVVPSVIHETYKPQQRSWLLRLGDFVKLVEERQRAGAN